MTVVPLQAQPLTTFDDALSIPSRVDDHSTRIKDGHGDDRRRVSTILLSLDLSLVVPHRAVGVSPALWSSWTSSSAGFQVPRNVGTRLHGRDRVASPLRSMPASSLFLAPPSRSRFGERGRKGTALLLSGASRAPGPAVQWWHHRGAAACRLPSSALFCYLFASAPEETDRRVGLRH